jgi:hypothetical protein
MALTTLDQVINAMSPPEFFTKVGSADEAPGVRRSRWYETPNAGAVPAAGMAGEALSSPVAGQIAFTNPVSGNTYLAAMATGSDGPLNRLGTTLLLDRLWQNSGIAVTTLTAQTVNSVAWPARDKNGSTNGEGVIVALEVSSLTGNGSAVTTITMDYTNQAGTAGQTGAISSFPATARQGVLVPFELAAGDTGVRSVQSVTLGTSLVSGVVHLVAYRLLALFGMQPQMNFQVPRIDPLTGGLVRLYDSSVPFLGHIASGADVVSVGGEVIYAQG